jgi:hypothetical protein
MRRVPVARLCEGAEASDGSSALMASDRDPIDRSAHLAMAEEYQAEIYRKMTPADRLRQALRLSSQMRSLMDAALRAEHPELAPEERRRRIAERILHARTG